MQGAVFRLGAGKIAKVWFHVGTAELHQLAEFYATLDVPTIRTPEILEVHDRTPYRATVEVELPGVPLYTVAPERNAARDCVLELGPQGSWPRSQCGPPWRFWMKRSRSGRTDRVGQRLWRS